MEQAAKLTVDTRDALQIIRSQWLSRIIHDFRGPIFAARGYAKLIEEGRAGDVTATQVEYLQHILTNLHKISVLVDGLHSFPSEHTLQLDQIDLIEVLQSWIRENQTSNRTLHINASLTPDRVVTIGDREKLTTSVHKLLGCAVEFSRSGGELRMDSRQEDDEFSLRITATRTGPAQDTFDLPAGDIASACDTLRLHGGSAHVTTAADLQCHVTVRLPVVNFDFVQDSAGR